MVELAVGRQTMSRHVDPFGPSETAGLPYIWAHEPKCERPPANP
jgi:hypothetical protein